MKLTAWREGRGERLGVVHEGRVLPIMGLEEFYGTVDVGLAMARGALRRADDWGGRSPKLSEVQLIPPVPKEARVLCAGVNYPAHAAEGGSGRGLNTVPDLFARWRSTLVASGERVAVPSAEDGLDWEGELAAIVGWSLPAGETDPVRAGACILGYTCFNDLSARRHQFAGSQAGLGKNADRSGPIGPVVVTADEIGVRPNVGLHTRIGSEEVQAAMTGQMIHHAPEIISYAAGVVSFRPGDVIATGTPEGVGWFRSPRRLLQPGETVEVEIEGIGSLSTEIC